MGVALLLLVLSCLECTNKSGLLGVPLAPVAPLTSPTHVGLVAVDYVAGPSLKTDHYKGSSEALHPSAQPMDHPAIREWELAPCPFFCPKSLPVPMECCMGKEAVLPQGLSSPAWHRQIFSLL